MKQFLYFSATWCEPCKQYKSVILQLQSQVNFVHHDVNQHPDKVKQYGIHNVPTMVLVVNGQEKTRVTGVKSATELLQIYNNY